MTNYPQIRFITDDTPWENDYLSKLVHWNKTFSNVPNNQQSSVNVYCTNVTARRLEELNIGKGEVKLLSTGNFVGYTSVEKCKNIYDEGEVITLPSGGTANIKYHNGKFISSGNYLARAFENVSAKFVYYHLMSIQHKIESFYRGSSIKHPEMLDVLSLMIKHPNLKIQNYVSSFLSTIDDLIASKKYELVKNIKYKDSMLHKMFPKRESNVPEVRFAEFTEDWNADRFSNLFDKLNNNTFSRKLLNYRDGEAKNIHYGDVLINYGFSVDITDTNVPFINNDVDLVGFKSDNYLKTGDVVFADTAEDTTAGKMVEIINKDNYPVLSGLHTYPCRPLIDFAEGFLGIYMNTSHFHDELIPYMQGSKVTGFNYEYLTRMIVKYPTIKEQKRIVDFFSNLESLISNQEKEIVTLERLKDTLLKKMFA